jgi:hypothetical protein
MAPANMVGILVHNSTQNSQFDEVHTSLPPGFDFFCFKQNHFLAMCHCQNAKQLFWHSSIEPIPDGAWNSSEIALLLDTARGCKNLCFCAENGTCYTSQEGKQAYLDLIPLCERKIWSQGSVCYDLRSIMCYYKNLLDPMETKILSVPVMPNVLA